MKVTKAVVKDFESIQRQHGTKAAIESVLWRTAAALYDDLGVVSITTRYTHRPAHKDPWLIPKTKKKKSRDRIAD